MHNQLAGRPTSERRARAHDVMLSVIPLCVVRQRVAFVSDAVRIVIMVNPNDVDLWEEPRNEDRRGQHSYVTSPLEVPVDGSNEVDI